MSFTNPANDPLRPFVYEVNSYLGSGPHTTVACFIALGVKVVFTVNCAQLDETLEQNSLRTSPLTDDDLAYTGTFQHLPNGDRDNNYDAKPIIEAAFHLAERLALAEAERLNAETFKSELAAVLARHYDQ